MAFLPLFDHLYCQEESLEMEEGGEEEVEVGFPLGEDYETESHVLSVVEAATGEDWAAVMSSLAARESEALPQLVAASDGSDLHLRRAREEAAEWVVLAASRHGFSALTALFAMNYFDRCFLPCPGGDRGPLHLQADKPWMGRLAAVACLSLAAKVEETRVPLLLDLQVPPPPSPVEEGGYLFEPKTVRRMELLVLSSLGWRMNPVTPLSFIHHLLPRLCAGGGGGGIAARIRELARRSEAALLSVIADWKWVRYPASVWAAAALLLATESQEAHRLISFLKPSKENLELCYQLMVESMSATTAIDHKRKHSVHSLPPSPRGVISSCFSGESSCDSWPLWPSPVSRSPEAAAAPPLKQRKCKTEQF